MSGRTFDRVADLPLVVERLVVVDQRLGTRRFERRSTRIRLSGQGCEGLGEDVCYEAHHHESLQRDVAPRLSLSGRYTLRGFSARLAEAKLFPDGGAGEAERNYRRWAFESAALDLALRQARLALAEALGRPLHPLRFVLSMGLGDPPSASKVVRWLERDPATRFKLDVSTRWNAALLEELRNLAAVDVVDFKAYYRDTPVDGPRDPDLVDRVARSLPGVWLEDVWLDDATAPALEPHRDRLAWDAPIHHVADIEAQRFRPGAVNIKPSRFGSVERLLDAYDHCATRGIPTYGGGQFEIGPGRGQIQYLASMFHAEAANDVAPVEFNLEHPPAELPSSPLRPDPPATGFRWGA